MLKRIVQLTRLSINIDSRMYLCRSCYSFLWYFPRIFWYLSYSKLIFLHVINFNWMNETLRQFHYVIKVLYSYISYYWYRRDSHFYFSHLARLSHSQIDVCQIDINKDWYNKIFRFLEFFDLWMLREIF